MYEQYWELKHSPFVNNNDPAFYFPSHSHKAAMLKLKYLVEHAQGAGLLVGGTGYGKTYLANLFAWEMRETVSPVVNLVFPSMSPAELLAWFAVELGAEDHAVQVGDGSLDRIIRHIETQLVMHTREGRHPLLIIDEAHLLTDPRMLQTLQLLLNFQQRKDVQFSLLLVGERTLVSQVRRMAQMETRVVVKSLLQPLSPEETAGYVTHRLKAAGRDKEIFTTAALQTIFELSGGVPQRINRLCDLALLVGYADKLSVLNSREIEEASEEITLVLPD